MGIARQSIEDLKKRSKISDFILSTTSGKLRGTKGMALCPFHGEKTASMSFTDVENLFHCFGCKEGGDIFKYVQEINNLEFQDAIEFVAEKYGFKLSYTQTNENNDFKVYQNKMELLNDYFIESMGSENSNEAKVYLENRKFDNNDINKYSISFIDKDEDKFNRYCKTNEITRDDLKRLGFMSSNENMLFKNRIMFPILSFRNDVIAYGGRSIDDFGPKYLNSSDSVLYKKNRNLYFTKEFITETKKKGYVFLVEGYFDVLSLNKLGFSNAASPSGTALTLQQLESVARYTNKILICFDNDEAGLKATERVLEIKNQVSKQLEIHCLDLPSEFKDISEVFETKPEAFKDILKNNDEIVEFLLNKFIQEDTNKKNVFNYFRKITGKLSPLEVDIALDFLSKNLNTEKEILKRELNFQLESDYQEMPENSLDSISIFQDIVTSSIVKNNFEILENEKEILRLNDDYASLIENLKNNNKQAKEFLNISFLPDEYEEAITRLFLYFADIKIQKLIYKFEHFENMKLVFKVIMGLGIIACFLRGFFYFLLWLPSFQFKCPSQLYIWLLEIPTMCTLICAFLFFHYIPSDVIVSDDYANLRIEEIDTAINILEMERANLENDENDFKIVRPPIFLKDQNVKERKKWISSRNTFFNPSNLKTEELFYALKGSENADQSGQPVKKTLGRRSVEYAIPALKYTTSNFHVLDIGSLDFQNLNPNNDPREWQAKSPMRYNLLHSQMMEIQVPCNLNIRAGNVIKVVIERQGDDKEAGGFDEHVSGKYLVLHLCHHFDTERSFTSMTLARDTYGLHIKD